jgi:hypothetical protein
VSETSVASQFHQSFDVHRDSSAKLSLHLVLTVNDLSDRRDLVFSKVVCLCVEVYTRLLQYLPRCAAPDPVDVSETYLDSFVFWQINACNSCQSLSLPTLVIGYWVFENSNCAFRIAPDGLKTSPNSTHPCRCLCLLFSQITLTVPLRRMILHLWQIFFTEALTFIFFSTSVFWRSPPV